ncbi:hypothetical protein J8I29_29560, partial [Labrys sp. LIt4]|nr:hypothetical protein [Labrys sp. LIt4]
MGKSSRFWTKLAPIKKVHHFAASGHQASQDLDLPGDFDWQVYVSSHTDLQSFSQARAEKHYASHGAAEGRLYSEKGIAQYIAELEAEHGKLPELFDWKEYLDRYPDLISLGSSYAAARHFLQHGRREGRVPYQFDADLYRSLYFKGVQMPNDALLEHYQSIGKRAGAVATLDQLAQAEGLADGYWLRFLDLEEFNLLNSRWVGQVSNKQEALRAMMREGFERLAPIS